MAEYIDRHKTVELLRSLGGRDYRREKGTIQDAIKMVSYAEYTPSADVVEVVRCKDCYQAAVINDVFYCTYWGKNTDENGYCHEGG